MLTLISPSNCKIKLFMSARFILKLLSKMRCLCLLPSVIIKFRFKFLSLPVSNSRFTNYLTKNKLSSQSINKTIDVRLVSLSNLKQFYNSLVQISKLRNLVSILVWKKAIVCNGSLSHRLSYSMPLIIT